MKREHEPCSSDAPLKNESSMSRAPHLQRCVRWKCQAVCHEICRTWGIAYQVKSTPSLADHRKNAMRKLHFGFLVGTSGPGLVRRGNFPVALESRCSGTQSPCSTGPAPPRPAASCVEAEESLVAVPRPQARGQLRLGRLRSDHRRTSQRPRRVASGFSWSTKRRCGKTRTIAGSSGGAPSLPWISTVLVTPGGI